MDTTTMTEAEYRLLPAINYSNLKHMRSSPLHFRHKVEVGDEPGLSEKLAVYRAIHTLVLEPFMFEEEYAICSMRRDKRTKKYQEFLAENERKSILSEAEHEQAVAVSRRSMTTRGCSGSWAWTAPRLSRCWCGTTTKPAPARAKRTLSTTAPTKGLSSRTSRPPSRPTLTTSARQQDARAGTSSSLTTCRVRPGTSASSSMRCDTGPSPSWLRLPLRTTCLLWSGEAHPRRGIHPSPLTPRPSRRLRGQPSVARPRYPQSLDLPDYLL